MGISNASLTIGSTGLGLQSGQVPFAVLGPSSIGTLNTPTLVSTPADIVTLFGYGPMPEEAALYLALAGGPVLVLRTTTDAVGVVSPVGVGVGAGSPTESSVTAGGGNTGTAVMTIGGTATAPVALLAKVITSPATHHLSDLPTVSYSFDGGATFLPPVVAVAGPTTIAFGVTVTWDDSAGSETLIVGDTFTATATPAAASGTSVPALSGTPLDAFAIQLQVVIAGASLAALTAAFIYSLDGGNSFSNPIAIPVDGAYAIPNTGLTVTWGSGSFVVGDVFSAWSSAPTTNGSFPAALAAMVAATQPFQVIHSVAGPLQESAVAGINTLAATAQAAGKYIAILAEVRDQSYGESLSAWKASIEAVGGSGAFAGFGGLSSNILLGLCAGAALIQSSLRAGTFWRRSIARLAGPRFASIKLSNHPGRVKDGPLAGLMPQNGNTTVVFCDGRLNSDLDLAQFMTLQTIVGRPVGEWYFTDTSFALATSDFTEAQLIRVMNVAAPAALAQLANEVNDDVPVKTDGSGQITEPAAQVIEAQLNKALRKAVVVAPNDYCTAASATVNRTDNLLATGLLRATFAIVPFGYTTSVTGEISFAVSIGS